VENPFARLRRELGLSQPALSLALGVSITAIWQAESGIVVRPRSLLRALAKAGYDAEHLQ
jgi:transcriptional regulator with XRE-family HTH domain